MQSGISADRQEMDVSLDEAIEISPTDCYNVCTIPSENPYRRKYHGKEKSIQIHGRQ